MQSLTQYVETIRVAIESEALRNAFSTLTAQCEAELRPEGILENLFASAILSGMFRLDHRPNLTEADRARIENSIRRNTAELRRLQTDRHLKAEHDLDLPGLISAKDVLRLRRLKNASELKNEPKSLDLETIGADLHGQIEKEQRKQLAEFALRQKNAANLKIRTHLPGRNTPCPCKSGQKFKRCCGSGAQPVYNLAA
jgi:hypothetical protein